MSNCPSLKEIIEIYNLKPHPEGGFAQLLYEDPFVLEKENLPREFEGPRPLWNGIYYLLPKNSKSILHKIRMNELWNFYFGCPLELLTISPDGVLKEIVLGHDISKGQKIAYVVPKDNWMAARPVSGIDIEYSFVSCITCPGFTFKDWEQADGRKLLKRHPHLHEIIQAFS